MYKLEIYFSNLSILMTNYDRFLSREWKDWQICHVMCYIHACHR